MFLPAATELASQVYPPASSHPSARSSRTYIRSREAEESRLAKIAHKFRHVVIRQRGVMDPLGGLGIWLAAP